ncbi:hypothetical protein SNOG_00824 [Parastagonospora nodorum SN15]|uniref:Uncharacterized protein n=1 Tax=Phaeosphaeria nodorum (strain SN15 / ATCC MYA-4574 / FGSC 10173) TaxID=321614 RepID=Q0V590_PHANO|nr:hypothetical protein SNOG_00824 [Parastagonospora nodorum SN15]EAT92319.1 hypothetical protein SNOG_00824 [Parastagonospora nodorum SN15]
MASGEGKDSLKQSDLEFRSGILRGAGSQDGDAG